MAQKRPITAAKFETQADGVARRAVSGGMNLSMLLSPAPAAQLRVPGSRSERLPVPVAARMEAAFDADLGAVRVHRDAAAQSITREAGARAMTAGCDVYFGAGAYAPGTRPGDILIAHELSHVLQQTGRRTSGGRMAATSANGDGAVQHQDLPQTPQVQVKTTAERETEQKAAKAQRAKWLEETKSRTGRMWKTITFGDLVLAHQGGAENAFKTFSDEVAGDLGITTPEQRQKMDFPVLTEDQMLAFEKKKDSYKTSYPDLFTKNGEGWGFLYDCLKKLGRFNAAVALLKDAPELKTVQFHGAIWEASDNADGVEIYNRIVQGRREVGEFQQAFLQRLESLLLTPSLDDKTIQVMASHDRKLTETVDNILPPKDPAAGYVGDNEITYLAYKAIVDLEIGRSGIFDLWREQRVTEGNPATSPSVRLVLVEWVFKKSKDLQALDSASYGFIDTAARVPMGEKIEVIATRIYGYWQKVLSLTAAAFAESKLLTTDPTAQQLRTLLLKSSKAFFALEAAPDLPRAPAYEKRVKAWQRDLTNFARQTLDPKLSGLRRTKDFDLKTSIQAQLYGYLLLQVHANLITHLAAYDLTEDVAQEARTKRDDVRGAHRLRMAQKLNGVAEQMGWTDLRQQSEPWFRSIDRKSNHLYLLSDWEPSAESDLSALGNEIPAAIKGWPITGEQLVRFFEFIETMWRADILAGLLAKQQSPEEEAKGKDRLPLHRQVNKLVAALPLPKRWEVKNYLFALLPATLTEKAAGIVDPGRAPGQTPLTTADLTAGQLETLTDELKQAKDVSELLTLVPGRPSELIDDHPKTKALVAAQPAGVKLAAPDYDAMIGWGPYGPGVEAAGLKRMDVFAWAVPSLSLAVSYMRDIEVFNQAIIKWFATATDPSAQNEWVRGLDAETWGADFANLIVTKRIDTSPTQERFGELWGSEQKRYRELLRKAAIVERQVLVARAGVTLGSDSIEDRIIGPLDIMRSLEAFESNTFPKVQLERDPTLHKMAELHKALALLQLAPALENSAQLLEDDAAIIGYWKLIADALAALDWRDTWLKEMGLDDLTEAMQSPDQPAPELLKRREILERLLAKLRQQRDQHQLRIGFRGMQEESDTAFAERHAKVQNERKIRHPHDIAWWFFLDEPTQRHAFLTGLYHPWRVEPGRKFAVDGEVYSLESVQQDFTYFPEYGTKGHPAYSPPILLHRFLTESGFEEWAIKDYGERRESKSLLSHSLTSVSEQLAASTKVDVTDDSALKTPLLTLRNSEGDLVPITGEEKFWPFLDKLAAATTLESISIGLQDTAELLTFALDIIMEVAVTIFGAGAGQAAKSTADVLQLLQSDELAEIYDAIQKDPLKLVRQVKDDLIDTLLTPENLITFLLFPSAGILDRLFQSTDAKKADPKQAKKKPARRGKLATVIVALIDLVKNVGSRVQAVRERAQGPMGSLRGRILTSPRMASAVDFITTYGPVIADFIVAIKERIDDHQDLKDVVSDFLEGKGSIDEELGNALNKLATFELPKEIVPLEAVVAAVGDLVLTLLARKPKWKLVKKIVTATKKDQALYKKIADEMKGGDLDPNKYWQEEIIPRIAPKFQEIRDTLAKELYDLLDIVLRKLHEVLPESWYPSGKQAMPKVELTGLPDISLQQNEQSFAEPYPDRGSDWPEYLGRPRLAGTAGAPLDPAKRAAAERRFGHDFRHVRLHTGGEGADATVPARALGLTSGSHIYLNPKVSPTSAEGEHVLDHELTHVLQQTGPRPLSGKIHGDQPKRARSGRLHFDPMRETKAEQTARKVRHRTSEEPLPIERADDDGIDPVFFDREFLMKIVKNFGSYGGLVTFQQEIDKGPKGGRKPAGLEPSQKLWTEIKTKLGERKGDHQKFAGSFRENGVPQKIFDHLKTYDATIQAAIQPLVKHSARQEEEQEGDKKKKSAKPKKPPFNLVTFANIFGGYIFALTGVSLQIGVKTGWDKGGTVLDKVFVSYLNLGKVALNAPLWNTMPLSGKLKQQDRIEFKQRLEALGPLTEVWESGDYAFTKKFIDKIRSYGEKGGREFTPSGKGDYEGKETPPTKTVYLDTKLKDGRGLRFGTHEELSALKDRGSRESHHTTQFLLAEYFYNQKSTSHRPFKKGWKLPWLTWGQGGPLEFKVPGKAAVRLKALYGDEGTRGGPMPAILLSYDTHRQGRLHINRLRNWGDDDETNASGTQAEIFHGNFRKNLRERFGKINTPEEWSDSLAKKPGDTAGLEFHAAMMDTYRWIEGIMSNALAEALPVNEVAYFRGVASRSADAVKDQAKGDLNPLWDLQPREVKDVIKDAKEKNKSGLEAYGWVL